MNAGAFTLSRKLGLQAAVRIYPGEHSLFVVPVFAESDHDILYLDYDGALLNPAGTSLTFFLNGEAVLRASVEAAPEPAEAAVLKMAATERHDPSRSAALDSRQTITDRLPARTDPGQAALAKIPSDSNYSPAE